MAQITVQSSFADAKIASDLLLILLDLIFEDQVVPDLFQKDLFKSQQLMNTLDAINAQYGKDAVFFAAMGTSSGWKGRSDKSSRHNTTDWYGLSVVKAGWSQTLVKI